MPLTQCADDDVCRETGLWEGCDRLRIAITLSAEFVEAQSSKTGMITLVSWHSMHVWIEMTARGNNRHHRELRASGKGLTDAVESF